MHFTVGAEDSLPVADKRKDQCTVVYTLSAPNTPFGPATLAAGQREVDLLLLVLATFPLILLWCSATHFYSPLLYTFLAPCRFTLGSLVPFTKV